MAPYVNEENIFRTCLVRRYCCTGSVQFIGRTGNASRVDGWKSGDHGFDFSIAAPNHNAARYAARNPTSSFDG